MTTHPLEHPIVIDEHHHGDEPEHLAHERQQALDALLADTWDGPPDGWQPPPDHADDPPALELFRRWSLAELLDEPDDFTWSVRGVLVHPTFGQIAGEMKTLKSYIATFLAVAVASGQPLFDQFTVDQAGPVLVYVGEGGRRPWTRRLRRICTAMGVNPADLTGRLEAVYDVAPIHSVRYQASLERDLDEVDPTLFILDPLYAYHGTTSDSRNLHEEGALLGAAVKLAQDRDITALIVNHFNQTGAGNGLKRITQSGSGEWADSWILLRHREDPHVDTGTFHLGLDIGSRQWGGTTWDLDLEIGRFNHDTGTHEGDITWDLRPAGRSTATPTARIIEATTTNPGELTKEDLAKRSGTKLTQGRALVERLTDQGAIHPKLVDATRSDGRQHRVWRYFPGPSPDDGRTAELQALVQPTSPQTNQPPTDHK